MNRCVPHQRGEPPLSPNHNLSISSLISCHLKHFPPLRIVRSTGTVHPGSQFPFFVMKEDKQLRLPGILVTQAGPGDLGLVLGWALPEGLWLPGPTWLRRPGLGLMWCLIPRRTCSLWRDSSLLASLREALEQSDSWRPKGLGQ